MRIKDRFVFDTNTLVMNWGRVFTFLSQICKNGIIRARETITSHFLIPSSGHLEPIFIHRILNVGFATPAVALPQIAPIWHKAGREFWEVIFARTLIS